MKNILLIGPAGAGKTTVANMIAEMVQKIQIASLGTGIKGICAELKYNDARSARELQQEVGQGMRRIFGDKVWCEQLWGNHQFAVSAGIINLVIDDGRQQSEIDYWISKGFVTVGITADREIRAKRLQERDGYDQSDRLDHETEITAEQIATEQCRYFYCNDGSIAELREMVQRLLEEVAE